MKCTGCGSKLGRKALFCGHCGVKVIKKGSCKTKKIILFIILIIVIGTLIFLGLKLKDSISFPTSRVEEESVEKESLPPRISREGLVTFEDYDGLYYVMSGRNKPYILNATGDYLHNDSIVASKDGKKVYSVDYDGNLCLHEGGKEARQIGNNVERFMISPFGDTVIYYEYSDYGSYNAYVKFGDMESVKIVTSDISLVTALSVSENGKYIAFTESVEDFLEPYKSYLYSAANGKIECKAQFILGVNDQGTILGAAMFDDETLMMTEIGKETEIIAQNVSNFIGNKDFSKLIIEETGGDIYIWNKATKEKKEVIAKNGMSLKISRVKGTTDDFMVDPVHFTSTQELDVIFWDDYGATYLMLDGYQPELIVPIHSSNMVISDDYGTIAYIKDKALYVKHFVNNQLKTQEKIADELDDYVYRIGMDQSGRHIAYIKNEDLYYLPPGKKEGFKIDQDVGEYDFEVLENGLIYYEKDDALYVAQGERGSEEIAEDVYKWIANNEGVYFVDYDDNLYQKIRNNKPQKISSEVYGVTQFKNQQLEWFTW